MCKYHVAKEMHISLINENVGYFLYHSKNEYLLDNHFKKLAYILIN